MTVTHLGTQWQARAAAGPGLLDSNDSDVTRMPSQVDHLVKEMNRNGVAQCYVTHSDSDGGPDTT